MFVYAVVGRPEAACAGPCSSTTVLGIHWAVRSSPILSGAVVEDATYAGGLAAIAAYPLVAIILLVRRRRIEPAG